MKTRPIMSDLCRGSSIRCFLVLAWLIQSFLVLGGEDATALRASALQVFKPLPARAPGSEKDTPAQVALGKALYFDALLSENRSQSCNTCHAVDANKSGVDNEPTSPGAFGKRGDRNSPTVWNSALHFAQFWDGRAPDLVEQAKGPVLNPVEMAMPSEAAVVQRLKEHPDYPKRFGQAFPGEPQPVTYENLARAIAAFERTLISRDRFDAFLTGNDAALTAVELHGLKLLLEVGCTTCHNGPLIGGTSYQKLGLVNPYEHARDPGRMAVTKDEDDQYKFKVPTLRNIALTWPYFHDGRYPQLPAAVKQMAWLQLGRELTDAEANALASFLNALNGEGLVPAKPAAAKL